LAKLEDSHLMIYSLARFGAFSNQAPSRGSLCAFGDRSEEPSRAALCLQDQKYVDFIAKLQRRPRRAS